MAAACCVLHAACCGAGSLLTTTTTTTTTTQTHPPTHTPPNRYGHEHAAPELQKQAVYGLTELARPAICKARLVANPGCYPTSVQLPLAPLLEAKLISKDDIIIDAKSGARLLERGRWLIAGPAGRVWWIRCDDDGGVCVMEALPCPLPPPLS